MECLRCLPTQRAAENINCVPWRPIEEHVFFAKPCEELQETEPPPHCKAECVQTGGCYCEVAAVCGKPPNEDHSHPCLHMHTSRHQADGFGPSSSQANSESLESESYISSTNEPVVDVLARCRRKAFQRPRRTAGTGKYAKSELLAPRGRIHSSAYAQRHQSRAS